MALSRHTKISPCVLILFLMVQVVCCLECETEDPDYIGPTTDEVSLDVTCGSNYALLNWSAGNLFRNGDEFIINYQCADEEVLMHREASGHDSDEQNTKKFPAPDARNDTFDCHYFGCYYDKEHEYFYLFDTVTCIFGPQSTPVQPSSTAKLQLSISMVPTHSLGPAAPIAITSVTKGHSVASPSPTSSQLSILQSFSHGGAFTVGHSPSTSAVLLLPMTETPLTFSTADPHTTPVPIGQLSLTELLAAVCVLLGLMLLTGTLLTVLLRRRHLRLRRESKNPPRVIAGLNDMTEDFDSFFPVNFLDLPQLPVSQSETSIVTILDKFGGSQSLTPELRNSVSLTPLHIQYLYDRVTDTLEFDVTGNQQVSTDREKFESSRSKQCRFVSLDGSDYVTLFPSDESGFGGSDMHSYFSVLKENELITNEMEPICENQPTNGIELLDENQASNELELLRQNEPTNDIEPLSENQASDEKESCCQQIGPLSAKLHEECTLETATQQLHHKTQKEQLQSQMAACQLCLSSEQLRLNEVSHVQNKQEVQPSQTEVLRSISAQSDLCGTRDSIDQTSNDTITQT